MTTAPPQPAAAPCANCGTLVPITASAAEMCPGCKFLVRLYRDGKQVRKEQL